MRQQSVAVAEPDDKIQRFARALIDLMYAHEGIGLAAIQTGVPLRLFVMDTSEHRDRPQVVINPKIVEQYDQVEWVEGCLSIPEIREKTIRSRVILLQFIDAQGREQILELSDLAAVCAQHEVDHLNGKLFIDQLSRVKYNRIREALKQARE